MTTKARPRPVGVAVPAIPTGTAGFVGDFHALQYLHVVPFLLDPLAFYGFDLFGALLRAASAVIWAWVAAGLWYLNPQAWPFVVAICAVDLILAGLFVLGGSPVEALLPSILVNAAALHCCLTPGARQAFGASGR